MPRKKSDKKSSHLGLKSRTDVTLSHAFTLGGEQVNFITDDVMVFQSGNVLVFFSISKREQQIIKFDKGVSLDAFAINAQHGIVIVALRCERTIFRVYSYPTCKAIGEIDVPGDSIFPISHLALSRDMSRMVSLSSVLDEKVTMWDLSMSDEGECTGTKLIEQALGDGDKKYKYSFVSINPLDPTEFCCGSENAFHVYRYETKFETSVLARLEATPAVKHSTDGTAAGEGRMDRGGYGKGLTMQRVSGDDPSEFVSKISSKESNNHEMFYDLEQGLYALNTELSSDFMKGLTDFATPEASALSPSTTTTITGGDSAQHNNGALQGKGGSKRQPRPPAGRRKSTMRSSKMRRASRSSRQGSLTTPGSQQTQRRSGAIRYKPLTATEKATVEINNSDRKILCHCWTPEQTVICGTQYGEIIVFSRESSSELKMKVLLIRGLEDVAIHSLILTSKFFMMGSSDGCLTWVGRQSFDVASSKQMAESRILHMDFSPSYKTFLTLDADGRLQLGSVTNSTAKTQTGQDNNDRNDPGNGAGASGSSNDIDKNKDNNNNGHNSADQNIDDKDGTEIVVGSLHMHVHNFLLCEMPIAFSNEVSSSLDKQTTVPMVASMLLMRKQTIRGQPSIPIPLLVFGGPDNQLFVANYRSKDLLGSLQFPRHRKIVAMSPSAEGYLLAVAFDDGVVTIVDTTEPQSLRAVFNERIHSGAIDYIKFSPTGSFVASYSQHDHRVYFTRTRDLHLSGYAVIKAGAGGCDVTCMDWLMVDGAARLCLGFTDGRITMMQPPDPSDGDSSSAHKSSSNNDRAGVANADRSSPCRGQPVRDFKLSNEVLRALTGSCKTIPYGLASDPHHHGCFFLFSKDKKLKRFKMEEHHGLAQRGKVVFHWDDEYYGHDKAGSCVCISPNGELIATGGADGYIIIRRAQDLIYNVKLHAHNFTKGGVTSLSFSEDSKHLVSAGGDGAVFCWNVCGMLRRGGVKSRKEQQESMRHQARVISMSLGQLKTLASVDLSAPVLSSFLEKVVAKALKGDNFVANAQTKLLRAIHNVRIRVHDMMKNNEEVHSREKLAATEFVIDTDFRDQEQVKAIKAAEVAKQDILDTHTGKKLLWHRIKTECLDGMSTKGASLLGMKSDLKVHNFPIRVEEKKKSDLRRKIQFLRSIEVLENQWVVQNEKDSSNNLHSGFHNAHDDDDIGRDSPRDGQGHGASAFGKDLFFKGAKYVINNSKMTGTELSPEEVDVIYSNLRKDNSRANKTKKRNKNQNASGSTAKTKNKDGSDAASKNRVKAIAGEHGRESMRDYVDDLEYLLYHPVQVFTNHRKITQILLLNAKCIRVKETFNQDFQLLHDFKEENVAVVNHKADRIKEIQEEMKVSETIFFCKMRPEEDPNSILSVRDNEIKARKPDASADTKEAESTEEQRQEEARKEAQKRALEQMMYGTLEMKKDLSQLEKALIRPDWMLTTAPEIMTDEQKAEVQAFERKEKTLRTERETRQRLLETELKKTRSDVSDVCRSFDHRLRSLYTQQTQTFRLLFREELSILSLCNDLMEEEQIAKVEDMFTKCVDDLADENTRRAIAVTDFQRVLSAAQKEEASLLNADKAIEKAFRRDFSEYGQYLDHLYRLFRQRTRKHEGMNAAGNLGLGAVGEGLELRPANSRRMSVSASGRVARRKSSFLSGAGGAGSRGLLNMNDTDSDNAGNGTVSVSASVSGATIDAGGDISDAPLVDSERSGDNGASGSSSKSSGNDRGTSTGEGDADADNNPFFKDSSSTAASEVAELDDDECPQDLGYDVWNALKQYRWRKIEAEDQLRKQSAVVNDLEKHYMKLTLASDHVQGRMKNLLLKRSLFQENGLSMSLNTEIMLRLQQGLVEIEESPVVTDLADCEMIDRNIVEDLNARLKEIGNMNVLVLQDMMRFRSGINELQWEKQILELTLQESEDLTHRLQLLRVTKNLQALIKAGGHDSRSAAEISVMERKLGHTQQLTKDELAMRKKKLIAIDMRIRHQAVENLRLEQTMKQLTALVRERKQISKIRHTDAEKKIQSNRSMALISERRQMLSIVKSQRSDIDKLRAERDRMRNRTFPSFIHVQSLQAMRGNVDQKPLMALTSRAHYTRKQIQRAGRGGRGGRGGKKLYLRYGQARRKQYPTNLPPVPHTARF